jgi:hypothetical protein
MLYRHYYILFLSAYSYDACVIILIIYVCWYYSLRQPT